MSVVLLVRDVGCSSIVTMRAGKVSASGLCLGFPSSPSSELVLGWYRGWGEGWHFALCFPAGGVLLLGLP